MSARPAKKASAAIGGETCLYTLEVCLLSGPMTSRFVRENRVVARTIQIRGNQTLKNLHDAIFTAFQREDEHFYEFQVGGKGPNDPKARRYLLSSALDLDNRKQPPPANLTRTKIGTIGLQVDEAFGYWFDYGDDWWHQINVLAIDSTIPKGKYPKVIKRVGQSPPQYVDWDQEEEEDDAED